MSAHALLPGGGRSFGPGLRAKLEAGASADFAAFESEPAPGWDAAAMAALWAEHRSEIMAPVGASREEIR